MDYDKRREQIIGILKNSNECISASELAKRFGVTRQIIVSDIALIRASGNKVIASRHGYSLAENIVDDSLQTIVCKHNEENIADEFYTVVDNGGEIVNVIVEHPLYGEITAGLSIKSRYEANQFIKRSKETGASQLSELTNGLHIHTIRVPDEAAYIRIKNELSQFGILAE